MDGEEGVDIIVIREFGQGDILVPNILLRRYKTSEVCFHGLVCLLGLTVGLGVVGHGVVRAYAEDFAQKCDTKEFTGSDTMSIGRP